MSDKSESELQGNYCLNCGTSLKGPYCHYCGQKKLGHEHGFFITMLHFIGDFIHFDSQIFRTIIPLVFKPGFLAREYIKGRRVEYLNPIRMYVFLSLVFFSLLYVARKEDKAPLINVKSNIDLPVDSLLTTNPENSVNNLQQAIQASKEDDYFLVFGDKGFNSSADYIKWQNSLPEEKRHGRFLSGIFVRMLTTSEKTGNNESFSEALQYNFIHNLPKLAFILLPLVALWLKLLYVRSGIPYMHQLILVIQSYNLNYLILTLVIAASLLLKGTDWTGYMLPFLGLHFMLTMKFFYQDSWKKTLLKAFLFFWGLIFMLATGAVFNTIYSIFTI